ncbi:hypothetical protein [Enhygromyxa salina]|uniref:Uncharacterized protein n=1 Tax=Enhygromyxa salina TaxID=215803 RepID=A0A2S9YW55_9BACT|nr:hypothetical protein [Enhygromyxa salina]PRQ09335.1 hypothetical protein ENSA7_09240 [Enhygromyxa salina]
MTISLNAFVGVLVALLGLIHLWVVTSVRRGLRMNVPGTWSTGTPQDPRLCVTGRPEVGLEKLVSPLTESPCAAWQVTLEFHVGAFGLAPARYHKYSAASFWLAGEDSKTRIVLHPGDDSSMPYKAFPMLLPPWRLLRAAGRTTSAISLVYGSPETSTSSHLAKRAHAVALELLACHELPADTLDQQVTVSETIVDFEQQWVCEGPCQFVDGEPAIVSSTLTTGWVIPPKPMKLTPRAELRAVALRLVGRELAPVLALDAVLVGVWVWALLAARPGI